MEYYSDLKKKETLPIVTIWMNPEGITLGEMSHPYKDKYSIVSLLYGMKKNKN